MRLDSFSVVIAGWYAGELRGARGGASTMDSGAVTVAVAQGGSQVRLGDESDCGAAEYDGDGDAVGGIGGGVVEYDCGAECGAVARTTRR